VKATGRIVLSVLLAVAVVAVVVFAVSNRAAVTVDLWPLPWRLSPPLYALVLGAGALGLVLGAALTALSRFGLWLRARAAERQAARLAAEAARRQTAAPPAPGLPARLRAATDDA
jgi:uncharacterized integral membrane protein